MMLFMMQKTFSIRLPMKTCNIIYEQNLKPTLVKVWNSITAFISFDEGIPSTLEKVLAKLKIIIEQIDVLRLKEVASGVPLSSSRTTTSCQEKCDVLGRDMDKEAIFELWQSDDASSNEICVVPIKGMGGNIGKTTLAQFVYNDNRVN